MNARLASDPEIRSRGRCVPTEAVHEAVLVREAFVDGWTVPPWQLGALGGSDVAPVSAGYSA
jgi:hypothetical protein